MVIAFPIEVGPLGRPLELGDVPGPNLVGSSGQQFGFAVMRSRDVPAPFFDLLVFGGQDAIHRPRRAQVLPVVEQGGIDLQRRLVLEALAVKHLHDGLPFRCCQRQRRPWPIDLPLWGAGGLDRR